MGHSHLPRQEWFAIGKTPGPQLLGELGYRGGCSVEASEGYTRQVFCHVLSRQWLEEGNFALDAGVCVEEAKMQKWSLLHHYHHCFSILSGIFMLWLQRHQMDILFSLCSSESTILFWSGTWTTCQPMWWTIWWADRDGKGNDYCTTRSSEALRGPLGWLWALRACLTLSFVTFGRSGRVTHAKFTSLSSSLSLIHMMRQTAGQCDSRSWMANKHDESFLNFV